MYNHVYVYECNVCVVGEVSGGKCLSAGVNLIEKPKQQKEGGLPSLATHPLISRRYSTPPLQHVNVWRVWLSHCHSFSFDLFSGRVVSKIANVGLLWAWFEKIILILDMPPF